MTSPQTTDPLLVPEKIPNFLSDLINAVGYLIFISLLWYVVLYYYPIVLAMGLLGYAIMFIGFMIILPTTFASFSRLFQVIAYQIASRQSKEYLNHPTKCPFLHRRFFTFSCRAEQLAPFDLTIFAKCHSQPRWEACWPERIPSILQVFDHTPSRQQQRLAFILAAMKEYGRPAALKMLDVLTNANSEPQVRIAAGYALAEMKEESGIQPLVELIGYFDQRSDQTIRAVIARYGDLALPYLIQALQDSDAPDERKAAIVEIIGRTKNVNGIPVLTDLLTSESTGDFTRLNTLYALQEIGGEESFRKIIGYLEHAPEDVQRTIKNVCLTQKMDTFPLLIDLLADRTISEGYYTIIGDILAEVDAKTYDRFFTRIQEEKGRDVALRLLNTLKAHTPDDEEEFVELHKVIQRQLEEVRNNIM